MKNIKTLVFILTSIFVATSFAKNDTTSASLLEEAWAAYEQKEWRTAIKIADQCIKLFEEEALKQQASLTELPSTETAPDYWALNDVGTCFYVKCIALEKLGDKKQEELILSLKKLAHELNYAQCWDTKGWYWQPAANAKKKLRQIEFETMLK